MAEQDPAENGKVPMAVLDRLLKISRENNEAYSAMVAAVDAISAKVMELGDQTEALTGTIEREQLSEVINAAVISINEDVDKLGRLVGALAEPKYNILKNIAEYMAYKKADEKEVQEVAKSIVWFMGLVTFIRENSGKILFLAGVGLTVVLVSNGITVYDILKAFFK